MTVGTEVTYVKVVTVVTVVTLVPVVTLMTEETVVKVVTLLFRPHMLENEEEETTLVFI